MLELADLHSIPLENEGYNPCRALVMVMGQGKTNQLGRVEVVKQKPTSVAVLDLGWPIWVEQ
ncbi:hypothetical protein F442_02247, partial [Phytophthora nicotianae P10297]